MVIVTQPHLSVSVLLYQKRKEGLGRWHLIKCLPTGERPEFEYTTPVYLNNIKLGAAVHACNGSTGRQRLRDP